MSARVVVMSVCRGCRGRGWQWSPEGPERCATCNGNGEHETVVVLPTDDELDELDRIEWAPCELCEERCDSQLELVWHNGGQPWRRCAGCFERELEEHGQRLTCCPCPVCRTGKAAVVLPELELMQATCTSCGWNFTVRPPLEGPAWGLHVLTPLGHRQPFRGWPARRTVAA